MRKNTGNDIRLTDELERQLMRRAIEEQFRFRPGAALTGMLIKVVSLFNVDKSLQSIKRASELKSVH